MAVTVPSYSKGSLPNPATAGDLARVTDDVRGLWMNVGTAWFQTGGETVNVKEFGALGDGTTNDSAAIQAAIDAASASGGGIVRLPEGVYRCGGLALPKGVSLVGAGMDRTTLRSRASEVLLTMAPSGTTADHWRNVVADMELDGRSGQGTVGLRIRLAAQFRLQGLYFHDFSKKGVEILESLAFQIVGCRFTNSPFGADGFGGAYLLEYATRTASETGQTLDRGATSTGQFRASLHVVATTYSSFGVTVQHSQTGLSGSWADLYTFSGVTSSSVVILSANEDGPVYRYVRAVFTPSGSGSATFDLGFAAYAGSDGQPDSVPVNQVSFEDCAFESNAVAAVRWRYGALLSLVGCDVEANGTNSSNTSAVLVSDLCLVGEGLAMALDRCWFERNAGHSDVRILPAASGAAIHAVSRSLFIGGGGNSRLYSVYADGPAKYHLLHSSFQNATTFQIAIGEGSDGSIVGCMVGAPPWTIGGAAVMWPDPNPDGNNVFRLANNRATAADNAKWVLGSAYSPSGEAYRGNGVRIEVPFALPISGDTVGRLDFTFRNSGDDGEGPAARIEALRPSGQDVAKIRVQPGSSTGGNFVTAAEFDPDSTSGNSRLLLFDVTKGSVVRVSFGANDSAGTGYRSLRVPN